MAGRREPPVASNQPAVVSAWEPLRRPVFRTLWIASIAANVGAWMQGVAAAWLMTSLSPSPTLVALADIVDRRKLLIVMQVWLSLALAVLTWVGAMTPALLLALTFALGLGSGGYGILLGCFGAGAVAGATLLPRFRRRASLNLLVSASSVVMAATTVAVAFVANLVVAGVALLVGGMARLITTAQMVLPAWVRASGLAVYALVFQACIAVGSAGWGLIAERLGLCTTLALAAVWLVLALGAGFRWRLVEGEGLDLSPSLRWPEPAVVIGVEPEEGPVLVTVEYRVYPER